MANYTAPFTPSGPSVLNVTFFSKLDLSAEGDHEIVITNVNGTSPNIFWLDFFLVYTSPSQNPTGSSSSGVAAVTATPSSGSGSKTISVKTAGGIIGGVAGGLVLVILLLVTYIVQLKRRHKRSESMLPPLFRLCRSLTTETGLVQPYDPPSAGGTAVAVSPRRKAGSPPILPSLTASESAGPSSAVMSAVGSVVPISASRVNVASSTGALSENGASASGGDNASMTESGAGLLVRQPHHDRDRGPGPTRSPGEVLSLAQSLLHAVAQGQGAREDPRPGGAVAMDSGLRLYNEAMLPPSYSSS